MTEAISGTPWASGRFDGRRGPSRLLFGSMHEDDAIERRVFRERHRIFCIASAGCTAIALSLEHDVVAVDVNPEQVAYAAGRLSGRSASRGAAERRMAAIRALAPLAGWAPRRMAAFLELDVPTEQLVFWRRHLDTRRFRKGLDLLLSRPILRLGYGSPFLRDLPPGFGAVLRGRLERGFARHPNRGNPYVRALLLGELPQTRAPSRANRIRLVAADAAAFLENEPQGSFDGFALSNILDGAGPEYRRRLLLAVRRAAAPEAAVVVRSFSIASDPADADLAAEDRSMLWGAVRTVPAECL
jgi:S-adenosylmethionine:diacylglycerol 3-amino-3-carboxypropyl transferase